MKYFVIIIKSISSQIVSFYIVIVQTSFRAILQKTVDRRQLFILTSTSVIISFVETVVSILLIEPSWMLISIFRHWYLLSRKTIGIGNTPARIIEIAMPSTQVGYGVLITSPWKRSNLNKIQWLKLHVPHLYSKLDIPDDW